MAQATAETPASTPTREPLETSVPAVQGAPMRVLFATDGSAPAADAAHLLALMPLPPGSSVDLVTVLDAQTWQVPQSLRGAEQEWARGTLQEAQAALAREGVELHPSIVRGAPAHEILEIAREKGTDLVVVGSRGRTGLERFFLGSIAENVAKHAPCSVLLARAPRHGMRRVLLAIDGSEHAKQALALAVRLPLPPEASVTVCNVVRPYNPPAGPEYTIDLDKIMADVREQQLEDAERLVATAAQRLAEGGRNAEACVLEGDPASEILELSEDQEADLVVVGARGHSAIGALLVGSVADRLLRKAPCSVLVVR